MGSGSPATRGARGLATLVAVLVAGGCSGSAEGSTTSSTTSPTTTTTTTTTTVPVTPRKPADEASVRLATAAVLRQADAGDGWSVQTEGGPRVLTPQSCSHRDEGPEAALGAGAAQDGPVLQLGEEEAYLSSTSYAFAAEQQAVQWIETVRTSEWSDCTLEQLAAEHDPDGELELELDSRQIDHLGEHGFEAFAQFYGRDADGTIALVVNVMHYRLGKVVLENTLVREATLDPADWNAVDAAHGAAVATAWERLNELR
jgi:hypothetical protein